MVVLRPSNPALQAVHGHRRRRWFQFRLRTLFFVVTLCALLIPVVVTKYEEWTTPSLTFSQKDLDLTYAEWMRIWNLDASQSSIAPAETTIGIASFDESEAVEQPDAHGLIARFVDWLTPPHWEIVAQQGSIAPFEVNIGCSFDDELAQWTCTTHVIRGARATRPASGILQPMLSESADRPNQFQGIRFALCNLAWD